MKKFATNGTLSIDLSSNVFGESESKAQEIMELIMSRVEDVLGTNLLVQLEDGSVHNVKFNYMDSSVEDIEEVEDIKRSHAATNNVTHDVISKIS